MRTECVTKVWEFYRDNCDGFKEPMRKQLRELDEHVDQIAAENAKLRDGYSSMSRENSQTIVELSDAHYCIDQLKAENAKLRELARDMWLDLHKQLTPPWSGEYKQRMRELGVEVDG